MHGDSRIHIPGQEQCYCSGARRGQLEMPGLITITITEHRDNDSDRDWLRRKVFLEPKNLKRIISDVSAVIDKAGEDDPDDT